MPLQLFQRNLLFIIIFSDLQSSSVILSNYMRNKFLNEIFLFYGSKSYEILLYNIHFLNSIPSRVKSVTFLPLDANSKCNETGGENVLNNLFSFHFPWDRYLLINKKKFKSYKVYTSK